MNDKSYIVIAVIMIAGSSLSFLASFGIIVAITRSGGLKSPYRRIIFGMSISDIFQSLAILLGPFAVPASHPNGNWAIGNDFTCQADGFILILGTNCTPIYMFVLCLYTALKIKKNVSDAEFTKRFERIIHAAIIVTSISIGIAGLVLKSIDSTFIGNVCTFALAPSGCRSNPEVLGECDPEIEKHVTALQIICSFGIPVASLFGIICCMGAVCWHTFVSTRTSSRQLCRQGNLRTVTSSAANLSNVVADFSDAPNQRMEGVDSTETCNYIYIEDIHCEEQRNGVGRHQNLNTVRFYHQKIIIQACLFVVAFLGTFLMKWIVTGLALTGNEPPPLAMFIGAILFPLGGVFNMLVYTHPQVTRLRVRQPELPWFRAFKLVVESGVEVPKPIPVSIDDDFDVPKTSTDDKASPKQMHESSGCGSYNGSNSFGNDEIAYRSQHDWEYNAGKASGLDNIMEEDEESLGDSEHSSDRVSNGENDKSIHEKKERIDDTIGKAFEKAMGRVKSNL